MKKIVLKIALFLFVSVNICSAQDSRTPVCGFCHCLKTAVISVEHPIEIAKSLLEKVDAFELEHPSLTRVVSFTGRFIMAYLFCSVISDYHNKKKLAVLKKKRAELKKRSDRTINQESSETF